MTTTRPTFELVLTGGPTPHQFTAFVPDGDGGRAAEQTFEWRTDSTALAMDLGALAHAAIAGKPPENDLHKTFGASLFKTVFAGAVGALWQARFAQVRTRREPLRLALRVDPDSARPLLNLPWEYLHDGHDFLALNWRTPMSRLPWGLPAESLPPLTEPLRLVVLIAAPLGLSQNRVLNTAREEDIILGALAGARRAGQIEIEFAPNGTPEALDAALREFDPHLLHFVGHGVFVSERDTGLLLMEAPDGRERQVENREFAELIERRARSLRFVFLSACQSAVAPRNDGYADLAPRLLAAGVPAVVAMQFSVLNVSAMDFGGAVYKALADGEAIDAALTEGRGKLAREGLNTVDFATPALFLSDPDCLRVDRESAKRARPQAAIDLTGAARAQNFVGRAAELRELQTSLDPERGRWRAAIIHGLGGMGKTVLAARLAERMASRFDGVKAIRVTPTTTAQAVLDLLGAFLLANNVRFDTPLIAEFNRVKHEPLPLETKAAQLIEILQARRLLVIFDNFEDVLPDGRAVSRAASTLPPSNQNSTGEGPGMGVLDPDLPKLVSLLLEGVPGPSRFLFTSRVDFNPLEPGRLSDAIGRLALGEMQFRDAVYLMETLPPLSELPVATTVEAKPDQPPPPPRALSMRDLYERLGGHPYTLNLFAEHARRSSAQAVLDDLAGVRRELLDFTLLDRAVARLTERASVLLRRAAIYDEPAPLEGLAFLLGDEQDAMPGVNDEVAALLGWGLLARVPGTDDYAVHTLVRDWARDPLRMSGEERQALLRRAAQYWLGVGGDSHDLAHYLSTHHYLFEAGDYEQAGSIVSAATEPLHRWGQIELLLRLLTGSVRTLSGGRKAVALGNLATMYKGLGDYTAARRIYEQVLAEFEALGDRRNVATALRQLGTLHQAQGEYDRARQRYEQALVIFQELGDRRGVAGSLGQLGILHQDQGEYERARQRYEQSLTTFQELGNRAGVAVSLHQLGILHHLQGEYDRARQRYEQSLAMLQELGDRAGVAGSLHELGRLHQAQGEYDRARQRYEQSLVIFQELGDRRGVASSLPQLGRRHQDQGEYDRARQRYEQSLTIKQELGDRAGVARSLHNLGALHQAQGEYNRARQRYEQSLAIAQELGDRAGMARSLHNLGALHQAQGEYDRARQRYEQSLAIKRDLGDRAGVASSLHNLGALHQAQSEYGWARQRYEQSLAIKQDLGDRAGVARSLHQLGRLFEQDGDYIQAVRHAAQAFAILNELGSPDRDVASRTLARLRDKMGEEAFDKALQQASVSAPSGAPGGAG